MQEKSNRWIYVVIIVVVAALMVAGVAMYRHGKDTREARAKAQELIAKLNAAGLKAPSEDTLFGVDGGVAAQDPDDALTQSQYAWQLGTSGPASRPVILDPDFVKAEEIFLSVYAPDKLPGFREFVNDLELEETTE